MLRRITYNGPEVSFYVRALLHFCELFRFSFELFRFLFELFRVLCELFCFLSALFQYNSGLEFWQKIGFAVCSFFVYLARLTLYNRKITWFRSYVDVFVWFWVLFTPFILNEAWLKDLVIRLTINSILPTVFVPGCR